jgi:hypothetical protein
VQSLAELRERHRGPVITAEDRGFDEARATFNGMIERHPELIVRPIDLADVVTAVLFAREADLPVAVRGGGHGVAGHCIGDGSLVVDLRLMRQVVVDPQSRTATCGGGALWEDLDTPGQRHGLATPGGTFGDTGVAGLTLGGGIGHLTPSYGLTLDNLLGATVVAADGSVLPANENENAELFWALRGGGGNFGVVVDFTFQLHPVGLLLGGSLDYRLEDAPIVLPRWRDLMASAPDSLASFAQVYRDAVTGEGLVNASVAWVDGLEAGREAIRELTDGLSPMRNTVRPMYYSELQDLYGRMPFGLRNYWSGRFLGDLSDELLAHTSEQFLESELAGGCPVGATSWRTDTRLLRCNGIRREGGALERDLPQRLDRAGRRRTLDRNRPRILDVTQPVEDRRRLSQLRHRGVGGRSRNGVRHAAVRTSTGSEASVRPGERLPVQPQHRSLTSRRLASRMRERLVDDLPVAVDPRQREVVDKRDAAPGAVLRDSRGRGIPGLLDGDQPSLELVVCLQRLGLGEAEELLDRHVEPLSAHLAEHPGLLVERGFELRDVSVCRAVHVELHHFGDRFAISGCGRVTHVAPPFSSSGWRSFKRTPLFEGLQLEA